MDLNYKTNLIFPTPIHQFDVNGFNEIQNELIDYIYKIREKDSVGHVISNRGGWQSKGFDLIDEDDILQLFLINCLSEFPPIKKSVELRGHAWININKPGAYNVKHDHPGCDLAGVLWVKAPKNSGEIVFEAPYQFQAFKEIKSYNDEFKNSCNVDQNYYFPPNERTMLVFPSHLPHQVNENKSNEDRISVSFNIRLQV